MGHLSSRAAQRVMSDMVNSDLRIWVSQLMRDAQQAKPAEVPPPPGTVFDMPPLPAFDRIISFCGGEGDVLRLIEEVGGQRGGGDGQYKRKALSGLASPRTNSSSKKKSAQICRLFASVLF